MREFRSGMIVKHFKRETMSKEEIDNNPSIYLYKIIVDIIIKMVYIIINKWFTGGTQYDKRRNY